MEAAAHNIPPSTLYSQPWWRGVGDSSMSSSVDHIQGSIKAGALQSQANGDNLNVEKHTSLAQQSGI